LKMQRLITSSPKIWLITTGSCMANEFLHSFPIVVCVKQLSWLFDCGNICYLFNSFIRTFFGSSDKHYCNNYDDYCVI
jgi:hypothetical protein